MNLKSELICCICKLVLSSSPISLPCSHVVCNEHLRDDTVKKGSIRCLECDQEFDVPCNGFPLNKIVSSVLVNDFHLSDEEKKIKYAIRELTHKLERLLSDLKQKYSDLERISFDHFSEVRRQIDLQREELKNKIDQISLKMIDLVNEKEKAYKSTIQQSLVAAKSIDIEEIRRKFENEFRNPNLVIEEVQLLQHEHEQNISEIQARLNEFDSLGRKINSFAFEPSRDASFGILTTYETNDLIACAADNTIQMWNLASNECVATLEEHSDRIECLENIDEHRFASGSNDKTIKIWDSKNFACIKTLTGHLNAVCSLKSMTLNMLASSSYGEIKIWNLESGESLQTLNGHSERCIRGLVYLPNRNLVSCSVDKTIKVWDLARGECIQTLTGHSQVNCIILLRNGQLASGSVDKSIKIWNMESGDCVKTLKEHSNWVWRLEQLESGELVSCSADMTIKIWNLAEGKCSRILKGHTSPVKSVRVNGQKNTLVSCSDKGTIKTWNLKTGDCINTIVAENGTYLQDLIFI